MAGAWDVVVVGLGAAGSACAWRLSQRGLKVLALDRHHPPHAAGSSHGGSRITRQAIGEGEEYAPLALRAHRLWREAEALTGERLFLANGALMIGRLDRPGAHAGKPDFLRRTVECARNHQIPHELLDAAEASRRWPMLAFGEGESVYFEPGAGTLFPERCVAAQIALARRAGAEIRTGESVLKVEEEPGGVRVVTDRGVHVAGEAVIAAGPWAAPLLGPSIGGRLRIHRQAMHWFAPDDPAAFAPERFPVFIWMHGQGPADWFYGFPVLPGESGIKIAAEDFDFPLSEPPAELTDPAPDEARAMWARHAAGRVRGVSGRPVASRACLYTMAPDSRFLVGRDPDRPRVVVVSACSGHGFKHAPAVGDLVASLVCDPAPPPELAPFAVD